MLLLSQKFCVNPNKMFELFFFILSTYESIFFFLKKKKKDSSFNFQMEWLLFFLSFLFEQRQMEIGVTHLWHIFLINPIWLTTIMKGSMRPFIFKCFSFSFALMSSLRLHCFLGLAHPSNIESKTFGPFSVPGPIAPVLLIIRV